MMTKQKANSIGYTIEAEGTAACIKGIIESIAKRKPCRWLSTINANSFVVSRKDVVFSDAMRDADWLAPDGISIVMASRFLGGNIKERIAGSDIFFGLMKKLKEMGGKSVFFLGSSENTLSIIREKMKKDYPSVRLAGTYSPPFKPEFSREENDAIIRAINRARPDVLWVGMTAPKQEKWIYKNKKRLKVKFAGAIGAVFDFYAGTVKRAPVWMQKLGLEWFYRLVREPRRMWRRYLVNNTIFVWHVLKAKVRQILGLAPPPANPNPKGSGITK